ncbi:MAG: hypothetical protein HYY99_01545 [Candidatus Colwellbacteria bacterium]|nr:hypothetical protein [Candidatus Colwellbacteria bacterium]
MRAIKILFIGLVLILGAALVSQKADLENSTSNRLEEGQTKSATTSQKLPGISNPPEAKPLTVEKKVSAPPPLRAEPKEESVAVSPVSELTRQGIILETNLQRQQNNLGFLAEDKTLDATAAEKANDMCAKQYFVHVSPSGIGAAELADSFGYDYISIGENLALGPFASDAALVEAWMGSPGHRANILNPRFTEIGVGVAKCVFEGRSAWLAVQHFGKPISDCRRPDTTLKNKIDNNRTNLTALKNTLDALRAEIEASDRGTDRNYNSKVDEYNSLAKQHNALLGKTSSLIKEYNFQVESFNQCAGV